MTQTTSRLIGTEAIEYAEANGLTLSKYNDPIEDAREDLTPDEARKVAMEDARLIYVDVLPQHAALQMVRYQSGEVRVIDAARMIASDWLHHSERGMPLEDYALDNDITAEDLKVPHTVIRTASEPALNPEIIDFCADNSLPLPTDIETANAAWDVADACDTTIQAQDMVRLFPGQPEMHTTTRFRALVRLLR